MTFSSIDIHLHTEALLSTMNFLNNLLPTQEANTVEVVQEKEEKKEVLRKFSKAFPYQTLYSCISALFHILGSLKEY